VDSCLASLLPLASSLADLQSGIPPERSIDPSSDSYSLPLRLSLSRTPSGRTVSVLAVFERRRTERQRGSASSNVEREIATGRRRRRRRRRISLLSCLPWELKLYFSSKAVLIQRQGTGSQPGFPTYCPLGFPQHHDDAAARGGAAGPFIPRRRPVFAVGRRIGGSYVVGTVLLRERRQFDRRRNDAG
jgi:hypothetical protein